METSQNTQSRWRPAALALVVLAVALAASLFVTSAPAEAKQGDYRVATQTDTTDDDDAELDPWTKFCLLNADAEDFKACEAGWVEDDSDATAQFAARETKNRGVDAPSNWLCPAGTIATAFDMPIYDEQGLFVVGYETVWFCIDANNQPVG